MTNGRALSQLQPRSQRRGVLWAPTPESRGLDELPPAWGPLCSHTCLLGCIPPTAWRSSSQLDFLFFRHCRSGFRNRNFSLFSTSFHPYDTAYEKWTFFSLFLLWLPPSISIICIFFYLKTNHLFLHVLKNVFIWLCWVSAAAWPFL